MQPNLMPRGPQAIPEPQASPPVAPIAPQLLHIPKTPCRSAMHPGVYKLAVLCWAGLMAVFWVTFHVSTSASFMVAVGTVYACVFFGVPFVMIRMSPGANATFPSFDEFLRGRFDTIHGPIAARDALLQVIMVPLALGLGGVAMGIIIHYARIAQ